MQILISVVCYFKRLAAIILVAKIRIATKLWPRNGINWIAGGPMLLFVMISSEISERLCWYTMYPFSSCTLCVKNIMTHWFDTDGMVSLVTVSYSSYQLAAWTKKNEIVFKQLTLTIMFRGIPSITCTLKTADRKLNVQKVSFIKMKNVDGRKGMRIITPWSRANEASMRLVTTKNACGWCINW